METVNNIDKIIFFYDQIISWGIVFLMISIIHQAGLYPKYYIPAILTRVGLSFYIIAQSYLNLGRVFFYSPPFLLGTVLKSALIIYLVAAVMFNKDQLKKEES